VNEQRLAQALGWFSIGLGTAQLLAPRRVSRLVGAAEYPFLMRLLGLRELASGIGILTQRRRAPWAGARLAGDVMDLALLGNAMRNDGRRPSRLVAATAAVAGVTALDVACTAALAKRESAEYGFPVRHSLAVNRSPEELYRFWRNVANLPQFMKDLQFVTEQDDRRSHWVAKGPAGTNLEWDCQIIEDRPGELIAWRSLPGSGVRHSGRVQFDKAPAGHGSYVRVEIDCSPAGGLVGAGIARLLGRSPEQMVREDLRRFRQLMEAGEIPTTDGQPSARSRNIRSR
jgi:uncharacterized membrane protein